MAELTALDQAFAPGGDEAGDQIKHAGEEFDHAVTKVAAIVNLSAAARTFAERIKEASGGDRQGEQAKQREAVERLHREVEGFGQQIGELKQNIDGHLAELTKKVEQTPAATHAHAPASPQPSAPPAAIPASK